MKYLASDRIKLNKNNVPPNGHGRARCLATHWTYKYQIEKKKWVKGCQKFWDGSPSESRELFCAEPLDSTYQWRSALVYPGIFLLYYCNWGSARPQRRSEENCDWSDER